MFTNTKCSIYAGQDKVYTESVCLSTDVKPTTGIANGSTCIEMNTGKKFMFNEDSGEWVEVPSSGGGGGGGGGDSDFSTAQVTFQNGSRSTGFKFEVAHIEDDRISAAILLVSASTMVVESILYKGTQVVEIPFGVESAIGNGDVAIDEEEGYIIINGDGTVIVS